MIHFLDLSLSLNMNLLDLELLSEVFIKEEREDMLEDIIKEEEEAIDYKKEVEETDYIVKEEKEDLEG